MAAPFIWISLYQTNHLFSMGYENVVTIKGVVFHQIRYYGKWTMPYRYCCRNIWWIFIRSASKSLKKVQIKKITLSFSRSDLLVAFIIAVLFCWHVQHRSLRGLLIIMWGSSSCQYRQNVLYATGRNPKAAALSVKQHSLYFRQIFWKKVDDIIKS